MVTNTLEGYNHVITKHERIHFNEADLQTGRQLPIGHSQIPAWGD